MYLSNIHKAIMGELNKGNDKMVAKLRRYERIATYGKSSFPVIDVKLSQVAADDIMGLPCTEDDNSVVVENGFAAPHDEEMKSGHANQVSCRAYSVDAIRDASGGWDWNDIHPISSRVAFPLDSKVLSNSRELLKWMRENSFLSDDSKGKVRVEFNDMIDGVLIEVQKKSNGEPIIALSSVH